MSELWKCDTCRLSWTFEIEGCPECHSDEQNALIEQLRDGLKSSQSEAEQLQAKVSRLESELASDEVDVPDAPERCVHCGSSEPVRMGGLCATCLQGHNDWLGPKAMNIRDRLLDE